MATPDRFGDTGHALDAPATKAFAITPSDSVNFAEIVRGIYVGTAGNVVAVMKDGETTVTFTGVLAGSILPIRCIRVTTATTASNLVGLI